MKKRLFISLIVGCLIGWLPPFLFILLLTPSPISAVIPQVPTSGPGYWSGGPTPAPTPVPPSQINVAVHAVYVNQERLITYSFLGIFASCIGAVVAVSRRINRMKGKGIVGEVGIGTALRGAVLGSAILWGGFLIVFGCMLLFAFGGMALTH